MTNDYYEEQGSIEQWRDDAETQRLLDKACEGVEVPADDEEPKPQRFQRTESGSWGDICEDAPCCGCCGDSIDDGYGSLADDAWHDANEYPDW